ncbi:MAG: hypothetical protein WAM88_01240 [Nitrososphaeraceae archaeon]
MFASSYSTLFNVSLLVSFCKPSSLRADTLGIFCPGALDSIWINNSGIILEIIGFVLILNALRRPAPPKNVDIRSNIVYLENMMSTTSSWVKCVGISLIVTGVVVQLMHSLYM